MRRGRPARLTSVLLAAHLLAASALHTERPWAQSWAQTFRRVERLAGDVVAACWPWPFGGKGSDDVGEKREQGKHRVPGKEQGVGRNVESGGERGAGGSGTSASDPQVGDTQKGGGESGKGELDGSVNGGKGNASGSGDGGGEPQVKGVDNTGESESNAEDKPEPVSNDQGNPEPVKYTDNTVESESTVDTKSEQLLDGQENAEQVMMNPEQVSDPSSQQGHVPKDSAKHHVGNGLVKGIFRKMFGNHHHKHNVKGGDTPVDVVVGENPEGDVVSGSVPNGVEGGDGGSGTGTGQPQAIDDRQRIAKFVAMKGGQYMDFTGACVVGDVETIHSLTLTPTCNVAGGRVEVLNKVAEELQFFVIAHGNEEQQDAATCRADFWSDLPEQASPHHSAGGGDTQALDPAQAADADDRVALHLWQSLSRTCLVHNGVPIPFRFVTRAIERNKYCWYDDRDLCREETFVEGGVYKKVLRDVSQALIASNSMAIVVSQRDSDCAGTKCHMHEDSYTAAGKASSMLNKVVTDLVSKVAASSMKGFTDALKGKGLKDLCATVEPTARERCQKYLTIWLAQVFIEPSEDNAAELDGIAKELNKGFLTKWATQLQAEKDREAEEKRRNTPPKVIKPLENAYGYGTSDRS